MHANFVYTSCINTAHGRGALSAKVRAFLSHVPLRTIQDIKLDEYQLFLKTLCCCFGAVS